MTFSFIVLVIGAIAIGLFRRRNRNRLPAQLARQLPEFIDAVVLLMFSAANAWLGFDELPKVDDLVNPKSNLATEVYTADGKVLGKYF